MLPLNKTQIPGMFRNARALEQAGYPAEARRVYEDILRIDRRHGPAHFQLGQIHYKQRDFKGAIQHLEVAADLHPSETAVWQLYGRAVAGLADPVAVKRLLKQAKSARLDRRLLLDLQNLLRPSTGRTNVNLGTAPAADVKRAIDLLQTGRPGEAATLAQRLRRGHPGVAIVADILANAQAAIGEPEAAEENFRAATRLDPAYAESHCNFGRFLVERGRYQEGAAELRHALKIAPRMVRAMVHMGVAMKRDDKARAAMLAFRKALEIDPDNREARMELGEVLVGEQQPAEALEHLRRAAELGADATEVRIWIARAQSALGQGEDGLATLDLALAGAPDVAEIHSTRAIILQTLGRFDEARDAFRSSIRLAPRAGKYYRNFLTSEKLAADDPLIAQMEREFSDPTASDTGRMNFGFALAKAMEDSGQYDRVFTYLRPANDLMRKAYPFDIDKLRAQNEALKDSFRDVDFAGLEIAGTTDFAPIFVTGLPRSGTTLVEQIVSSHSAVTGGGELGFARRNWGEMLLEPDGSIRPFASVDPSEIAAQGRRSEAEMRALHPGSDRITDKSVQTFTMVGPIRASLPNARIIVVRRDPRDTLLSMYKNMFAAGKHLHSYNLRDLAVYYRLFEDILAFWNARVPGWIHEIRYEALIAEPEAEARRLIAACGLPWEDACLNFHQNKRRVDTLSVHQVRQPIYKSSVKAWQHYREDLTELFEALGGEYANPGDAGSGQ